jgi:hypothetical protein
MASLKRMKFSSASSSRQNSTILQYRSSLASRRSMMVRNPSSSSAQASS